MRKYRLIYGFRESYNMDINGKVIEILFTGGVQQPNLVRGFYMTSDKDIQKALEKSVHFNKRYRIEEEYIPEVEEPEAPVLINKDPIVVPEVTTWMAAASYFKTTYPDEFGRTTNKSDVEEGMKKYNIKFPNWEQK